MEKESLAMDVQLKLEEHFDPERKRHYTNGHQTVYHCHHYSTLYTQLAVELEGEGAVDIMLSVADESFGGWLKDYFESQGVTDREERTRLAELYWKNAGMGLVSIETSDEGSGTATMPYSHLDEGWLKKNKPTDRSVNFFTQGFLAGAFAAIYDKPHGSYQVVETKSLVTGDDESAFEIKLG